MLSRERGQWIARPASTVTLLMQTFERAGIVRIERGAVTVIDRARLEDISCECYRTIKQHFEEVGR